MKLLCKYALLIVFLANTSSAKNIYKCNINGKVVFTDRACNGKNIELKNINILPSINNSTDNQAANNVYDSNTWYYDYRGYNKALELSKKHGVPVFIYFQADWCKYCRKLEKELFNTSGGKSILSKVIKVKITPENGQAEDRFFKNLGGKGYPTIFIQKTYDSSPKEYYLMSKESGFWQTKQLSYLSSLIYSKI